jgi:hypothetical protein
MTRIICPKCDATMEEAGAFEAHMTSEHPDPPAPLGFGRTLL